MALTKTRRVENLYERDFHEWIVTQVEALRQKRWDDLDWDNLAEEVETVGRNDRRAIESHLAVLLAHLLKCLVQPERRTVSWDRTIATQREEISSLLQRNPSLRPLLRERFSAAYDRAVGIAARDTALDETEFPPASPFTPEEAMSIAFHVKEGREPRT